MVEIKSVNLYNGIKNDLKISIDDTFDVLLTVIDDVRKLKLLTYKPNEETAKALLDYLSWKEEEAKAKFELAFKKELELYKIWLELYCEENKCTEEEALNKIINDG